MRFAIYCGCRVCEGVNKEIMVDAIGRVHGRPGYQRRFVIHDDFNTIIMRLYFIVVRSAPLSCRRKGRIFGLVLFTKVRPWRLVITGVIMNYSVPGGIYDFLTMGLFSNLRVTSFLRTVGTCWLHGGRPCAR